MKEFVFGSCVYHYDLIRENRKTLSLTVRPDLGIVVKCPHRADDERVNVFLRKKWLWLEKQLRFFKKYQRKAYVREYVSGESFFYLGKQYELIVKRSVTETVSLFPGKIVVCTKRSVADGGYTKKIMSNWYRKRADAIFVGCYLRILPRFGYSQPPQLSLRDMKKRWGSFLSKNEIVLSSRLICLPRECIDFVIIHELCHVKYKNHDKRFYNFLEKKCPQWERTKEKLELLGSMIQ